MKGVPACTSSPNVRDSLKSYNCSQERIWASIEIGPNTVRGVVPIWTRGISMRMWIWHSLPRVSEGIPAAGMELVLASLLFQQDQLSLFSDSSDRRERYSVKGLRQDVYL